MDEKTIDERVRRIFEERNVADLAEIAGATSEPEQAEPEPEQDEPEFELPYDAVFPRSPKTPYRVYRVVPNPTIAGLSGLDCVAVCSGPAAVGYVLCGNVEEDEPALVEPDERIGILYATNDDDGRWLVNPFGAGRG